MPSGGVASAGSATNWGPHLVIKADTRQHKLSLVCFKVGGGKHNKASVIEQIPMGGYIISIFAQILGSLP